MLEMEADTAHTKVYKFVNSSLLATQKVKANETINLIIVAEACGVRGTYLWNLDVIIEL